MKWTINTVASNKMKNNISRASDHFVASLFDNYFGYQMESDKTPDAQLHGQVHIICGTSVNHRIYDMSN